MDDWPQAEAAWMLGHRLKLDGTVATGITSWPQAEAAWLPGHRLNQHGWFGYRRK